MLQPRRHRVPLCLQNMFLCLLGRSSFHPSIPWFLVSFFILNNPKNLLEVCQKRLWYYVYGIRGEARWRLLVWRSVALFGTC